MIEAMQNRPDLSDDEIDEICKGYRQNAAKIRYLRSLGLRVDRRPNGRALVARAEWARVFGAAPAPKQPDTPAAGPRWRIAAIS